jgi:hypothetical protein
MIDWRATEAVSHGGLIGEISGRALKNYYAEETRNGAAENHQFH